MPCFFKKLRFALLAIALLFLMGAVNGQAVNDYGAITSGSWTTTSIWRQWDGTGWNTVPTVYPSGSSTNVWILSGSVVTVNGTGPYPIGSLYVQSTAKLYANTTAQVYLSVWGSNIVCDGEIGNTTLYDGLSFNIEGVNCTASGTGVFTASRIRKSAASINPTTTFVVAMNIALRWSVSSATAIYNSVTVGNSRFDIKVNAGCTLNVAGSPTFPANLSVDGVAGSGGGVGNDAAGTYTIDGTLIVAGIIYATTDNTAAGFSAAFNITSTGVVKANQINSPNSGTAGTVFNVYSGGKLELTGINGFYVAGGATTWGITNNRYSFLAGSTVEYSAAGNQSVLARSNFNVATSPNNDYWNLVTSGSGTKTILSSLILGVRGNLTIFSPTILDQSVNSPDILIGGNWSNWGQAGFKESINLSKKVFFQGTGTAPGVLQQTITCPGGEVYTNLQIAKAASVAMASTASVKLLSPITVNNILTLGQAGTNYFGILELNSNSLTLENPAPAAITLQGATPSPSSGTYFRFIKSEDVTGANGSMVRWNIGATSTPTPDILAIISGTQNFWPWPYVIPFGISTASDTIPFGFYKPTTDNMGYLSVATYATAGDNLPWPTGPSPAVTNLNAFITANNLPDNRDWTVDRFWYVGATNPVAGCGVAFLYEANVNPSSPTTEYPLLENDPWNISAQYWDASRSTWALPQVGIGVGPLNIPFNPFIIPSAVVDTGFQVWNTHWALSSNASPLPIELLRFDARNAGNRVLVNWITSSEINNDHFTVERGIDGKHFSPIGTVKGAGTSSVERYYDFVDASPVPSGAYYRLKQTDYDGKTSYSEVRYVDRNSKELEVFTLSPNPARGYSVLGVATDVRDIFTVSLTDLSGRIVFSGRFDAALNKAFPIDLNGLSAGIYNLEVTGISANGRFRLVKE